MKTIDGDLIKMAVAGEFDVIVHGCNCFCTMGGGIALQIRSLLSEAYVADLRTTTGDRNKLGKITVANIIRGDVHFDVVNGYTQYAYGRDQMHVDYAAVRKVFKEVKQLYTGKRIGYPMIGAGLAGGDWEVIKEIIDEELLGENHTLVKYSK